MTSGIPNTITRLASDEVLRAWDDMDAAANHILTALPHQMSAAAERLEAARQRMRSAIQVALYARDVSTIAAKDQPHG